MIAPAEDADALAAVTGADAFDVLDQVDGLVAHHLVRVAAADESGARRFDLFESVSEFAAAELGTEGEGRAARDAHAAWVTRLVGESSALLTGADQEAGLARLDRELDNVREALGWCCEQRDGNAVLVLAAPLWRYWWMRGQLAEGRSWMARAIDGYRGEPGPSLGRALQAAGDRLPRR